MRSLEAISLIVLAISLVAIPLTWSKRPRWQPFILLLPAIAILLQLLIERYRWQMIPAYALSSLLFLVGLLMFLRSLQTSGSTRRRRMTNVVLIAGSFTGLLVVWFTVELCVQLPVFKMPLPGGPYAVGTRTFLLVDSNRVEGDSPIDNGFRTMSIQAWYPAELGGGEERVSYLNPEIRKEWEEFGGPQNWILSHQDLVQTNTYWDAEIAEADDLFPVVLYSPSGNASLHKILFEELASQGYVVVSISHSHWTNFLFDDQGHIIPQGGVAERYQAWFREADKQAVRTAQGKINSVDNIWIVEGAQKELNRARPLAIAELRQWAMDQGFVIDQITEMNQPSGFFDGQLDLNRIGVMGFSLGGAAAGQFCVTDGRCQAGINVDGFMFGDILDNNLQVPFMFFHSSNPGVRPVGALFYEWAENDAYMLQIADASHHDLGAPAPTGKPVIFELTTEFGQFPDGAYLAQIMNEYILAFFDKHLKDEPASILDGPPPYPEVQLFMMKNVN